ncbi:MAG: L-threonylcarbamoyladenylate synthase [Chlamydiae bacterium]|nr:L-threonylcarbamoyladenylate synthase [Chlamydiota bacterium]
MTVSVQEAIQFLKDKNVVAVPSETVFGLAASIFYPDAIKKIFEIKGRPPKNPLIVHFASVEQALEYVDIAPAFVPNLQKFWPGPLTVVAPLKKEIDPLITANLPTLAVRVPNHPVFLELIRAVGPLAAPSANRSGFPSATRKWHVDFDYNGMVPVVEGMEPDHGLESTILIQKEGYFLIGRLGATPIENLNDFFKIVENTQDFMAPQCPGQMYRHYAPTCKLTTVLSDEIEAIVGFCDVNYPVDKPLYSVGSIHHPAQVAHHLFETLRLLDHDRIKLAYVDTNFPSAGLYLTIHERLSRAIQETYHQNRELYV